MTIVAILTRYCSAMELDQVTNDCQAEPEAAMSARR